MENNNLIIVCITLIIIIGIVGGVFAFVGFGSVEMVNQDFGYFTMDVPEGSHFVEGMSSYGGLEGFGGVGFVSWNNKGETIDKVAYVGVSKSELLSIPPRGSTFLRTEDNLDIYKYSTEGSDEFYLVLVSKDNYDFRLLGKDLEILKKMANSIVVKANAPISADLESSSTSATSNSNSDGTFSRYCLIHGWVYTDSDYLCPYCLDEGYSAETTENYQPCPHHKDRGDGICAYCLDYV